jgi:uncharacterized membrane protein (UPF0136 family)
VTEIAKYSVLILSVLMAVGGIMGFKKAKSKPSLIAGVGSAIGLAACFAFSLSNPSYGLVGAAIITAILEFVFGVRLAKTKKFMPAGMLVVVNGIVMTIVIVSLMIPTTCPASAPSF